MNAKAALLSTTSMIAARAVLASALLACSPLIVSHAYANEIYVATNGSDGAGQGTSASPYATILKASQVAVPGSVIRVGPGSYLGGMQTQANGTLYDRIIYTTTGATITASSAQPSNGLALWWNSGDYVDIRGFNIDGSAAGTTSTWRLGIYNSGGYVNITGNTVHDILTNTSSFSAVSLGSGGAGIENDSFANKWGSNVIGNTIYNQGPSTTSSTTAGHGIYVIQNGIYANNLLYNIAGNGITTWHAACNARIVGNTVDGARTGGIAIGSGDSGAGAFTGDYMVVEGNIVSNSYFGLLESGTTGKHNQYYNNLLYNSAGAGFTIQLQNGNQTFGTITSNPLYINAASGNYTLSNGSPALGLSTRYTGLGTSNDPWTQYTDIQYNWRDPVGHALGAVEMQTRCQS